jgi:hypothetical protein
MKIHLSGCPNCREIFEWDQPTRLNSIGYTPGNVTVPDNLWQNIDAQIPKGLRTPTAHSPLIAKWKWRWLPLAAVASIFILVMLPHKTPRQFQAPHSNDPVIVHNRKIVIHSIKVANRPAKSVYFQSNSDNKIIVFVK